MAFEGTAHNVEMVDTTLSSEQAKGLFGIRSVNSSSQMIFRNILLGDTVVPGSLVTNFTMVSFENITTR